MVRQAVGEMRGAERIRDHGCGSCKRKVPNLDIYSGILNMYRGILSTALCILVIRASKISHFPPSPGFCKTEDCCLAVSLPCFQGDKYDNEGMRAHIKAAERHSGDSDVGVVVLFGAFVTSCLLLRIKLVASLTNYVVPGGFSAE